MTHVALLLADGFETIEALTVVDVLRRGGVDVATVSTMPTTSVTSSQGVRVTADALFDEYDFGRADYVVTPGGTQGTENLGADERVCDVLRRFMAGGGGHVASICAAPSILARLGLLDGRIATCFPGFEREFPAGVRPEEEGVYHDGNLITASGMGWSLPFALEILRDIAGQTDVDRVKVGLAL